jgi:L-threonylcarbamoyladenylate synthase
LTATSANRSGLPAAITPDEVVAQLGDSLDILIDGGRLPVRSGSTILDLTVDPPVLLREGPVTFDRLNDFLEGKIRNQSS